VSCTPSFLGNILRHEVDIGANQRMTVDVQNARGDLAFATGASVALSWRVDDSVILWT
jgi:hypothetical protein